METNISRKSLREAKSEFEEVLKLCYQDVLTGCNVHSKKKFDEIMKESIQLLDNDNSEIGSLMKGYKTIFGDSEVPKRIKNYIDNVKNALYEYMGDSSRDIPKVEMTHVILGLASKPILDMVDSFNKYYYVMNYARTPKQMHRTVKKIQDRTYKILKKYITSHENERIEKIMSEFEKEKRHLNVRCIFVQTSGIYPSGDIGQAIVVGSYGELLEPLLFSWGKDTETLEKLKEKIEVLPLRPEIQKHLFNGIDKIIDEYTNKTYPDPNILLQAHPLNFDFYMKNMEYIVRITKPYLERYGRKICIAFAENDGLLPSLFPENLVGRKIFYDPNAMNLKNRYVNAILTTFGYEPILPYSVFKHK